MKIVFDPTAAHNVYLDVPRCFIVFNDTPDLTMEQICDSDIREVRWAAGSNRFADCAWSSDCSWYFIIVEAGIFLFHLDGTGRFCRKRSAKFIEAFLDAPRAVRRK